MVLRPQPSLEQAAHDIRLAPARTDLSGEGESLRLDDDEAADTTLVECSSSVVTDSASDLGKPVQNVLACPPTHTLTSLLDTITHLRASLASTEASAQLWKELYMVAQSELAFVRSSACPSSPVLGSSVHADELERKTDKVGVSVAVDDKYRSMLTVALRARRAALDFKYLARYWEKRARATEARFGEAYSATMTPSASDVSDTSTSESLDPARAQAVRDLLARRAAANSRNTSKELSDADTAVLTIVEKRLVRAQATASPLSDSDSTSSSSTIRASSEDVQSGSNLDSTQGTEPSSGLSDPVSEASQSATGFRVAKAVDGRKPLKVETEPIPSKKVARRDSVTRTSKPPAARTSKLQAHRSLSTQGSKLSPTGYSTAKAPAVPLSGPVQPNRARSASSTVARNSASKQLAVDSAGRPRACSLRPSGGAAAQPPLPPPLPLSAVVVIRKASSTAPPPGPRELKLMRVTSSSSPRKHARATLVQN